MHTFLSYISQKTLDSAEYTASDKDANEVLSSFDSKEARLKFYDDFLGANKIKQSSFGQFHTPEQIVNIVLDCLPQDFEERMLSGAKLLDPSCGTGNFLIEVIRRIEKKLILLMDPEPLLTINAKIIPNIYGIEIDPVVVEAAKKVFDFEFDGKLDCPTLLNEDSLLKSNSSLKEYNGFFDFVVGNPPWVEVKNLEDKIKDYVQSTYNVSNLYGAFIVRGKEFLKKCGNLSYVIPRSFTGGKYYSSLREKIRNETTIDRISYYKNRNQKFHGGKVLQEMVILSFTNVASMEQSLTRCIPCANFADFSVDGGFDISQKDLFSNHDMIMILADSREEFLNIKKISSFKNFEEQGFRFSTGQLVTHRSLDFLRKTKEDDSFRIIYASDILNSSFNFSFASQPSADIEQPYAVLRGLPNLDGRKKNQAQELTEISIEKYCNEFSEIIICRRRSHKGDKRRFVGVYLSDELPEKYFIDNGVNFVVRDQLVDKAPSLKSLSRLLRSDLFEYFFECISSNTQLNKNDMYLFGIPSVTSSNTKLYSELESCDFNDVKAISPIAEKLYEISMRK